MKDEQEVTAGINAFRTIKKLAFFFTYNRRAQFLEKREKKYSADCDILIAILFFD